MSTVLVNTHEAKSRLSELIRMAESGDEVILARNGVMVARIVPWSPAPSERVPGGFEDTIWIADDFDSADDAIADLFEASTHEPLA
jgi:prevent-host-death family protein